MSLYYAYLLLHGIHFALLLVLVCRMGSQNIMTSEALFSEAICRKCMIVSHSGEAYSVYESGYHMNQRDGSQAKNNNRKIGIQTNLGRKILNAITVLRRNTTCS
mgnify:FL=1